MVSKPQPKGEKRKWIGVMFECCEVYARLYVNRGKTAYEGRCPRCQRKLTIRIAPHGINARFFRAW